MQTSRYFEEQVFRKRPYLKREWCRQAIEEPIYYEMQEADGRIRHWIYVAQLDCYLRVITLSDGETVHNAFVDRNFQP